jgi:hypothetical protein
MDMSIISDKGATIMKHLFYLLLAAAIVSPAMFAAEESAPENGSRRSGARSGGTDYRQIQEQLKARYPAEYAEIERLSQTDRRAAFEKTRALAEKAGIPLSFGGNTRGPRENGNPNAAAADESKALAEWQKFETEIKSRFPLEYAEVEKLKIENPTAALAKLKELAAKANIAVPEGVPPVQTTVLPRNINRLVLALAAEIVQERYPAEYAAMLKLRETDPDAARDQFRALAKRAGLSYDRLKRMVLFDQAKKTAETTVAAGVVVPTVAVPAAAAGVVAAPTGVEPAAAARKLPTDIGDPAETPAGPGGMGGMGGMPPGPPPVE